MVQVCLIGARVCYLMVHSSMYRFLLGRISTETIIQGQCI